MATRQPEHPDAELLADLAADVLPEDLARRVETHVVDCAHCSGLLAEAEGIRGLLRRETAPAIPEDVADRIGAAIAALRLGPAAGERTGLDDDPEADARWAEAAASGAVGAARGRRTLGEDSAGEAPAGWAARRKAGRPGSVTRLRRAASTPAQLRRQALEEQRSAERTGRIGRVLLAAAAVVVFVGAGGVAVRLFGDAGVVPTAASNSDSGDSGSAAGGAEDQSATAPERATGSVPGTGGERSSAADGDAPVVATGTNYTAAGLEGQARLLVATAGATLASGGDAKATTTQPAPSPAAGPQQAAKPPAGNEALKTPAALRACLQALNVADEQVVAVDLARYEGRDSAVIVLRASGGAYDVWVVARDCRPGADGTLKYVPMAP